MTRWRGENVHLVLLGTGLNRPQRRTLADWKRVIARLCRYGAGGEVVRGGFGRIGMDRNVGAWGASRSESLGRIPSGGSTAHSFAERTGVNTGATTSAMSSPQRRSSGCTRRR